MKYERLLTEDECEEKRQVLGYPQLIFLVIILAFGVAISFLIFLIEFVLRRK